jgi:hypothetical protein
MLSPHTPVCTLFCISSLFFSDILQFCMLCKQTSCYQICLLTQLQIKTQSIFKYLFIYHIFFSYLRAGIQQLEIFFLKCVTLTPNFSHPLFVSNKMQRTYKPSAPKKHDRRKISFRGQFFDHPFLFQLGQNTNSK